MGSTAAAEEQKLLSGGRRFLLVLLNEMLVLLWVLWCATLLILVRILADFGRVCSGVGHSEDLGPLAVEKFALEQVKQVIGWLHGLDCMLGLMVRPSGVVGLVRVILLAEPKAIGICSVML